MNIYSVSCPKTASSPQCLSEVIVCATSNDEARKAVRVHLLTSGERLAADDPNHWRVNLLASNLRPGDVILENSGDTDYF